MKQSLAKRLLLVRFFTELKTRQPKLFYFCLFLTAVQLFCTAIKLEITPFMLYGMYSEKYSQTATLSRHQIVVDGNALASLHLPFREKMFLQTVGENYLVQWQNKSVDPLQSRVESRYPIFTRLGVYPFLSQRIYNLPAQVPGFEQWFSNKLASITKKQVHRISIIRQTFQVLPYSVPVKLVSSDTLRQF